jgi:Pyridoxamine 5'-phosphate oxidase
VTQPPQGDPRLLDHEIARRLLASTELARVSYLALDGKPRVVPMMFHWDDELRELILCAFTNTWKVAALRKNPEVAITIDTSGVRPEILSVRGPATVSDVEGIAPEYVLMNRRYLGEQWSAVRIDEVRELGMAMVRIAVRPDWVGVIDFRTRFPGNRQVDEFRSTHFYV